MNVQTDEKTAPVDPVLPSATNPNFVDAKLPPTAAALAVGGGGGGGGSNGVTRLEPGTVYGIAQPPLSDEKWSAMGKEFSEHLELYALQDAIVDAIMTPLYDREYIDAVELMLNGSFKSSHPCLPVRCGRMAAMNEIVERWTTASSHEIGKQNYIGDQWSSEDLDATQRHVLGSLQGMLYPPVPKDGEPVGPQHVRVEYAKMVLASDNRLPKKAQTLPTAVAAPKPGDSPLKDDPEYGTKLSSMASDMRWKANLRMGTTESYIRDALRGKLELNEKDDRVSVATGWYESIVDGDEWTFTRDAALNTLVRCSAPKMNSVLDMAVRDEFYQFWNSFLYFPDSPGFSDTIDRILSEPALVRPEVAMRYLAEHIFEFVHVKRLESDAKWTTVGDRDTLVAKRTDALADQKNIRLARTGHQANNTHEQLAGIGTSTENIGFITRLKLKPSTLPFPVGGNGKSDTGRLVHNRAELVKKAQDVYATGLFIQAKITTMSVISDNPHPFAVSLRSLGDSERKLDDALYSGQSESYAMQLQQAIDEAEEIQQAALGEIRDFQKFINRRSASGAGAEIVRALKASRDLAVSDETTAASKAVESKLAAIQTTRRALEISREEYMRAHEYAAWNARLVASIQQGHRFSDVAAKRKQLLDAEARADAALAIQSEAYRMYVNQKNELAALRKERDRLLVLEKQKQKTTADVAISATSTVTQAAAKIATKEAKDTQRQIDTKTVPAPTRATTGTASPTAAPAIDLTADDEDAPQSGPEGDEDAPAMSEIEDDQPSIGNGGASSPVVVATPAKPDSKDSPAATPAAAAKPLQIDHDQWFKDAYAAIGFDVYDDTKPQGTYVLKKNIATMTLLRAAHAVAQKIVTAKTLKHKKIYASAQPLANTKDDAKTVANVLKKSDTAVILNLRTFLGNMEAASRFTDDRSAKGAVDLARNSAMEKMKKAAKFMFNTFGHTDGKLFPPDPDSRHGFVSVKDRQEMDRKRK